MDALLLEVTTHDAKNRLCHLLRVVEQHGLAIEITGRNGRVRARLVPPIQEEEQERKK